MPAPIDPSGFQMSVEVILQNGEKFPLWMRPSESGVPETIRQVDRALGITGATPLGDLPIVESVEITMSRGLTMGASINIVAPYELGLDLLSTNLFVIGNAYEVRIGYPRLGRFLPWMSFRAEKPDLNISPDEGLTATLNGTAGSFAALRGASSRTYTGSYRDILQEIAERGHNQWLIDFPDVEQGSAFDEQRDQVSQGNKSEWFFVQQIARSANCDAFMLPSREQQGRPVLTIRRRKDAFAQSPRFTFVMRGQIDMETVFPLFNFSSPSEGVWVPRSQGGVTCTDIDPDDGSVQEVTADALDSDTPRLDEAAVGGDQVVQVGSEVVANHPSLSDDRETGERCVISNRDPMTPAQQVRSLFEEGSTRGGIQASGASFGIPELFPNDIITLGNLGIFSGNYLVDSMTHRAGPGEWTMDMKFLANSVALSAIAEDLRVTPTSINTRTAPELADGSENAGGGGTTVTATEEV